MLHTVRKAFALFVASGLLVSSAQADVFSFVDREGVVHLTNAPGGGKPWKRMSFPTLTGPRHNAYVANIVRDRSADRFTRYDALIREAARLYQLPEAFIRAVMSVESDFDARVVSVDGAMGLMQLMPDTAKKLGVSDAFDPRQNVHGGARFLRILANQWNGDLVRTIASYNAGGGAVEKYDGVPPYRETRRYVNRVLAAYYAYRAGQNPKP